MAKTFQDSCQDHCDDSLCNLDWMLPKTKEEAKASESERSIGDRTGLLRNLFYFIFLFTLLV